MNGSSATPLTVVIYPVHAQASLVLFLRSSLVYRWSFNSEDPPCKVSRPLAQGRCGEFMKVDLNWGFVWVNIRRSVELGYIAGLHVFFQISCAGIYDSQVVSGAKEWTSSMFLVLGDAHAFLCTIVR